MNPADLGLNDQVQTLTVVDNPDEADDDHVFCGFTANNDGRDCKYTFKKLLEHQTWHFQVYALNEDASGDVGTSQASDSKSADHRRRVVARRADRIVVGGERGDEGNLDSLG